MRKAQISPIRRPEYIYIYHVLGFTQSLTLSHAVAPFLQTPSLPSTSCDLLPRLSYPVTSLSPTTPLSPMVPLSPTAPLSPMVPLSPTAPPWHPSPRVRATVAPSCGYPTASLFPLAARHGRGHDSGGARGGLLGVDTRGLPDLAAAVLEEASPDGGGAFSGRILLWRCSRRP